MPRYLAGTNRRDIPSSLGRTVNVTGQVLVGQGQTQGRGQGQGQGQGQTRGKPVPPVTTAPTGTVHPSAAATARSTMPDNPINAS